MADEGDVGRLFLEPPDRFVAARDALAKELRAAGDKDRAAEVKKLKRPTAAAWAVDQLALRRPDDVRRLLDAGAALREAHEAALGGSGSAADLRAAAEDERAAVEELTADARTLLEEADLCSDAAVERVRQTLHGAAGDEELREQVRTGQLSNDRGTVGLGPGGLDVEVPPPAPKREKTRAKAPKAKTGSPKEDAAAAKRSAQEEQQQARGRREAEKQRAREKREAEKRRREEERRAKRDLEAAEKAYERAREAAEQAHAELETRERELREARERIDALD